MDKKNEHFWDEAAQKRTWSEPQDPASKRTIQALQTFYQIENEDRQSTQRVWDRLMREADLAEQSSQPLPLPLSHPPTQQWHMWRRPVTIVAAVLIAALLVGSMVTMLTLVQQKGGQPASPGTATTYQTPTSTPTQQIGKRLGKFTLGMTLSEVEGLMKPAQPATEKSPDGTTLSLTYGKYGVRLTFAPLSAPPDQTFLREIIIWPPFEGTTAESFGVGMSFEKFFSLYGEKFNMNRISTQNTKLPFPLFRKEADAAVSVTDEQGTTLWALFDKKSNAVQLVLRMRTQTATPGSR